MIMINGIILVPQSEKCGEFNFLFLFYFSTISKWWFKRFTGPILLSENKWNRPVESVCVLNFGFDPKDSEKSPNLI